MKKIIPKIVIAIIFIFIVLLFQYSNNQKLNENSIVENDISKYNCDLEIISKRCECISSSASIKDNMSKLSCE